MYINDFQFCIDGHNVFHFADDTKVIFSNPNIRQLRKSLNKQITKIYDWLCANRLSLNAKKTELVLFHSKNKKVNTRLTIKIKGTKIFLSNHVKYLGVMIDSKLSWKKHISELAKKLNRATAILAKVRHYVHKSSLKTLYYSLFQSYLSYGCLVWGFANKCLINKIFRIQKRAIRLISFSRYKAHSSPLFHKLGILKVFDLIAIFRFQFVHDWIHKRLPTAFDNMFLHESSKHYNLRRNDDKVSLPFRRLTKWGTNTLRYQGAIIHNSLVDLNLHNTTSKLVIKNKLKSIYLSSYV